MAYTVLSKSDAARGKMYHLLEISTNRSVEFKLDDGVTEEEITTIVDQFLEEETKQKEREEKIQKAMDEALLPDEAKTE